MGSDLGQPLLLVEDEGNAHQAPRQADGEVSTDSEDGVVPTAADLLEAQPHQIGVL